MDMNGAELQHSHFDAHRCEVCCRKSISEFPLGVYAGLVYVPIDNFLHRRWVRYWLL